MGENIATITLMKYPNHSPKQKPKIKYDQTNNRHGQPPLPSEKYDDLADINRVLTLPDQANHRDVDKIVLSANNSNKGAIKTAIVAPPTIYGFGRGPLNTISKQIPSLTRFILNHGYGPIVGTGKTEWDHIHIRDVSSLLVSLIDAALDSTLKKDPEVFGERAYYFCESGTHVWGEVAAKIGAEAVKQGLLKEIVVRTTHTYLLGLLIREKAIRKKKKRECVCG